MCFSLVEILRGSVKKFFLISYTYKIHRLKPKEVNTVATQSCPVLLSADRTLGLWV